jgi:hypothetical protein
MADREVKLAINLTANSEQAKAALASVGETAAQQGAKAKAAGGGGINTSAVVSQAASGPLGGLVALGVAAGAAAAALKAVSLAQPGVIQRLNIAFEDTLAVVGQALAPAFEALTSIIRTVGDVLATIMPPAGSLREILQPIADTFRELMEALAPVLTIIKDVLVVALKALAVAIQIVLLPFKLLASIISAIFGGEQERLKSSVGAAARNISFTNQESGAKSIYQAAFRSGVGEDKANIPGWLEKIHGLLNTISAFVKGIAEKLNVKSAAEGIGVGVGGLGGVGIGKQGGIEGMIDTKATRQAIANEIKRDATGGGLKNIGDLQKAIDLVLKKEGSTPENDAIKRQIDDLEMRARRAIDGHPGGR